MPKKNKPQKLSGVLRVLSRSIDIRTLDLRMDIAAYYGSADAEQRKKLAEALSDLRRNLADIEAGTFDPAADGLFDDQHD